MNSSAAVGSTSSSGRLRFRLWNGVALAAVLGFLSWRIGKPSPPLPIDRVSVAAHWADERRCGDCHEQAESFARTGHAQTLRPAADADLRALLLQLNDSPEAQAEGVRIEASEDHVQAVHVSDGVPHVAPLDWCLGSGHHARTWVGMLTDSWGASDLIEFRWTWYGQTKEFQVTPGQPPTIEPGYFGGLGMLYDHPKARRCLACHATRVAELQGHLPAEGIWPGVTCQRCHGPRGEHVETDGAAGGYSWQGISQLESIRRCAECHRRAEEQQQDEIHTRNATIVRFQPVGLVQSPCFRGSPEMTCLTCHDPHRPLAEQDSQGIWQCTQCHDGGASQHRLCSAGHREDCVRCHMPKVETSPPLKFTDHWIRIRDLSESAP